MSVLMSLSIYICYIYINVDAPFSFPIYIYIYIYRNTMNGLELSAFFESLHIGNKTNQRKTTNKLLTYLAERSTLN